MSTQSTNGRRQGAAELDNVFEIVVRPPGKLYRVDATKNGRRMFDVSDGTRKPITKLEGFRIFVRAFRHQAENPDDSDLTWAPNYMDMLLRAAVKQIGGAK
jgi:hypothetical protein